MSLEGNWFVRKYEDVVLSCHTELTKAAWRLLPPQVLLHCQEDTALIKTNTLGVLKA